MACPSGASGDTPWIKALEYPRLNNSVAIVAVLACFSVASVSGDRWIVSAGAGLGMVDFSLSRCAHVERGRIHFNQRAAVLNNLT